MAIVARVRSLLTAFEGQEPDATVWLDPELGLVTGTFPTPASRFDFSVESFVSLRPAASAGKSLISLVKECPRIGRIHLIETADTIYRLGSATHALKFGLDWIEQQRPGTLDALADQKKRTKRPVARTRAELYDKPHPDNHSDRLKSGFFVGTNNKADEAIAVLKEAVSLAGLQWGLSFSVRPESGQ